MKLTSGSHVPPLRMPCSQSKQETSTSVPQVKSLLRYIPALQYNVLAQLMLNFMLPAESKYCNEICNILWMAYTVAC